MNKRTMAVGIIITGVSAGFVQAEEPVRPARDYLTEELEESRAYAGIELAVGAAGVYQRNVRGGASTNDRKGEFEGSYDVELSLDLQQLMGFDGTIFVHGEGGWTDAEGIDERTVGGSLFGVNADAIGNRSLDIVELFYETALTDRLSLTVGKIDFTGFFDASAYANDEAAQFLNGALVNNPAISFPDYSLGVILTYNLSDTWYVMGGAADAQADGRETGFRTALHGEDAFFYMLETGVTTAWPSANGDRPGTYRFGVWHNPIVKSEFENTSSCHDDTGLYLSFDQALTKENTDPQDSQGLGGFFRYGYAPGTTSDITHFYSVGFQYQGLLEGRDDDVLGAGYAHGRLSDSPEATYTEDYESVVEVTYSAQLTEWLNLSPSLQYVTNPAGDAALDDAVVLGLRAVMAF